MTERRVSRFEAQLTRGYARAHELERSVLRLERECDELLERAAQPEQLRATLAERRGIESELAALRRRLAEYRQVG